MTITTNIRNARVRTIKEGNTTGMLLFRIASEITLRIKAKKRSQESNACLTIIPLTNKSVPMLTPL